QEMYLGGGHWIFRLPLAVTLRHGGSQRADIAAVFGRPRHRSCAHLILSINTGLTEDHAAAGGMQLEATIWLFCEDLDGGLGHWNSLSWECETFVWPRHSAFHASGEGS